MFLHPSIGAIPPGVMSSMGSQNGDIVFRVPARQRRAANRRKNRVLAVGKPESGLL
jgi:hypothetical protein